jgi:RNA polymerase sigma-70 factor (ECF subfamily)
VSVAHDWPLATRQSTSPWCHGELLRQVADRDLEAFEILYRRYARSIYGLARRRLCDRERAAEATRRAFAAIWRSASTYAPERGDGARWLFAVARNAIAERASGEPEAAAEDGWQTFRIHAAVAELPEQERVSLELAYWEGRSPSEIAEALGLPLGAVRTCTRSALAHLAVLLGDRIDA